MRGVIKPDCNKTIDFFAEVKRLCNSRTRCTPNAAYKERCPLFVFCKHAFAFCEPAITANCAEETIKAIEILQKWSNEHPERTYAQDFFEKFPKA